MENLQKLLRDLQSITLQDISEIPPTVQHELALQIEELQDQLRELAKERVQ